MVHRMLCNAILCGAKGTSITLTVIHRGGHEFFEEMIVSDMGSCH